MHRKMHTYSMITVTINHPTIQESRMVSSFAYKQELGHSAQGWRGKRIPSIPTVLTRLLTLNSLLIPQHSKWPPSWVYYASNTYLRGLQHFWRFIYGLLTMAKLATSLMGIKDISKVQTGKCQNREFFYPSYAYSYSYASPSYAYSYSYSRKKVYPMTTQSC